MEKSTIITFTDFGNKPFAIREHSWRLFASNNFNDKNSIEYVNGFTKILSSLLPNIKPSTNTDAKTFSNIKKGNKKIGKLPLSRLAKVLEESLIEREWFVTGLADPQFFSEDFQFEDPDVKVSGLEEYCKGVQKIFNQKISRAEVICVAVNETLVNKNNTKMISVLWRLSGGVNLAFGLTIKPFLVRTDFIVSPISGLIISQKDSFSIPGYDILLSALLPAALWRIPFLVPPAAPAETLRQQYKNKKSNDINFDNLFINKKR